MTKSNLDVDMSRRDLLKTGAILAIGIGAGMSGMWKPNVTQAATGPGELPAVQGTPTAGNARAMEIAQKSALARGSFDYLMALANQMQDSKLRQATLDMLANPAATYQLLSPTQADKEKVMQELTAAGLLPKETTLEGVFPGVADPKNAPQAFWSAPGSGYSGHHSYPAGLASHVAYNALIADQMFKTYETVYSKTLGAQPMPMSWDTAVGSEIWHDVAKPFVLQWTDDNSLTKEQQIAGTGAHHTLGGAEAIVRGMPPLFVLAMLSAHDYPASDSYKKVVDYARAAATIARVDPVDYGLVQPDGKGGFKLNPEVMPIEAFISHLSDHDWVFSGASAGTMIAELKSIAQDKYGIDPEKEPAKFNDFRNRVFAALSDIRLYNILMAGGRSAVVNAIAPVVK